MNFLQTHSWPELKPSPIHALPHSRGWNPGPNICQASACSILLPEVVEKAQELCHTASK